MTNLNSLHTGREFWQRIFRFVLLLAAIQLTRGLLIWGMWAVFRPESQSLTWQYMDIAAFTLVGLALLLIFRPSTASLGLDLGTASRLEKSAYPGLGLLILVLVASSYWMEPGLLVVNFATVVALPIFEELLFRGYGWGRLQPVFAGRWVGLTTWLAISILFGLWHFGYLDIYLLKVAPSWPQMRWDTFLLMKFLTTFVIGLLVGLPRWRTGRVYGAIFLHALVNLFGR